jgi:hypothetical protein
MQSEERREISILKFQNWNGSGYHTDIDAPVII